MKPGKRSEPRESHEDLDHAFSTRLDWEDFKEWQREQRKKKKESQGESS